jgi:hypothetical protein
VREEKSRIALQLSLLRVRVAITQGVTILMTALYDISRKFGPTASLAAGCTVMSDTTGAIRTAGAFAHTNPHALALRHAP